jgi:hypothetical protein
VPPSFDLGDRDLGFPSEHQGERHDRRNNDAFNKVTMSVDITVIGPARSELGFRRTTTSPPRSTAETSGKLKPTEEEQEGAGHDTRQGRSTTQYHHCTMPHKNSAHAATPRMGRRRWSATSRSRPA